MGTTLLVRGRWAFVLPSWPDRVEESVGRGGFFINSETRKSACTDGALGQR